MKNILSYKNIFGQYRQTNDGFLGQLIYVNITVPFFGKTEEEMYEAFKRAVDGYLCFCAKNKTEEKIIEKYS